MSDSIKFIQGKKKTRGELRLPQLHFIAMDDWVDKIGEKAYIAWQKFYTWADRSQSNRETDTIPNSMNNVIRRLNVGKDTFYKQIIRPLWNYGFIDFQEFNKNGTIYLNIIVYEYPQNNPHKATEPLERVRDYDTEHISVNRQRGKKGGRPKVEPEPGVVLNQNRGGSEPEPGVVLNQNRGGSEPEPNNVLLLENNNEINIINQSVGQKSEQIKTKTPPPKIQSGKDRKKNKTKEPEQQILSEALEGFLKQNGQADRRTDIEQVYLAIKNQEGYSDALFIGTLHKAVKARINVPFSQYLLKAMIRNMNDLKASTALVHHAEKKESGMRMPEWILQQEERERGDYSQNQKLSEEERQQAAELLRTLGEIK
jgi:hypothetical protein